jgi:hypothetical protein
MIPKLGWCPFCSAYLPLQFTRLSLVSCPLDDYTLPSSLLHGAKLLYRFIFFVLLANSMCRPDQRHDMLFFHHFAFLSNPTTQYSVIVRVGFRKPLPLQHSRCESQLAGVTTDPNGLAVVALLVAVFTSLHFGCRTPRSHSSNSLPLSNATSSTKSNDNNITWIGYAYVRYITNTNYLGSSLMILEALIT